MSHDTALVKQTVRFHDTNIDIVDHSGERWAMASEVADALGYLDPHNLLRLIDRNADEFEGRQGVVKLTTPGGEQEVRILSYHGVIRAAMLAKTDRARAFRDWAETVLFKVMTTGAYNAPSIETMARAIAPVLRSELSPVVNTVREITDDIDGIKQRLSTLERTRESTDSAIDREILAWQTAAECVRTYRRVPKGFNRGGRFDAWAAEKYRDEHNELPRIRRHPLVNRRRHEFVYPRNETATKTILRYYDAYEASESRFHQLVMFSPHEKCRG